MSTISYSSFFRLLLASFRTRAALPLLRAHSILSQASFPCRQYSIDHDNTFFILYFIVPRSVQQIHQKLTNPTPMLG